MTNEILKGRILDLLIDNIAHPNYSAKTSVEKFIPLIKEYAKEKCREQREICDEVRHYQTGVSDAPEPNFD